MYEIEEIEALVGARSAEFLEYSDRVWDRPELRWEEHTAVAAQIELARAAGFRVTEEVGGIPTAFYAEAGAGGPVIAILGEYDALAGLSQAADVPRPQPAPGNESGNGQGCGHNLLGAGGLLAAVSIAELLRTQGLPGRVRYYGCPAEEGDGGKTFMVARGAFSDVDIALTWHPGITTRVIDNPLLAVFHARFRFEGRASHASISPQLGRSALDAVELMNVGSNYLREHMPDDARLHYAITDSGGLSPNVVQRTAEVYYSVRSPRGRDARELFERVQRVADGAALMTDTAVRMTLSGAYSEVLHNRTLEGRLQQILEHVGGVPFDDADRALAASFATTFTREDIESGSRSFGGTVAVEGPLHEGVIPENPRPPVRHGSTDVGDVSWVTPTAQFYSACWAYGTPNHSWQAVAQGKSSYAHKGVTHAATVLTALAIDLFTDGDLRQKVVAEHESKLDERPYESPYGPEVVPPPLRAEWTGSNAGGNH